MHIHEVDPPQPDPESLVYNSGTSIHEYVFRFGRRYASDTSLVPDDEKENDRQARPRTRPRARR